MIRLRGQMVCMTQDEVQAVRAHLPDHLALTRAEPGCLTFEVTETDDPMVYEVMEAFRDRPSFDAHQARTRDSAWFTATRGIVRDFRLEVIGD
jgi:quinol monooxygenase YgiN